MEFVFNSGLPGEMEYTRFSDEKHPLAYDFGTRPGVLHLGGGVQNSDMPKAPCQHLDGAGMGLGAFPAWPGMRSQF